ncbi:GNAT family N-acetyltransferase [Maridesulfovibrio hydrothermalis]|uniref:Acetyltransferase, GNAT family n=1 Tax=Maridesulfovibrio hydrothermalis AM13 = DSM 14728 TaxID=1121451 RepID=L0RFS9_9BACT|nr:GNAT family N-acetyltransferase [Maridesulfovibrio hydrothermalis]CCO25060.1 Acetyltransferase, GNAT family [Maridesulfovibrio hydrothermalis AM13 = DSM 14728]
MAISYSWTKNFKTEELEELFLSVEWESGKYPAKLQKALLNSHKVYSVWDGERLIGMINSMTDTVLTVYFQYLLVHPDYQGHGLGKKLVGEMLEIYSDIPRKILISVEEQVGFYQHCGFTHHTDKAPMFVSTL